MELGLQFGYGMIAHTKKLIEDWGGGRVVLSPRDLDETQLLSTSSALSELGGTPYLDPQCYDRSSNHDRLNEHDYWTCFRDTSTGSFLQGHGSNNFMERLRDLIVRCGIQEVILPSVLASEINEAWLHYQDRVVAEGRRIFPGKKKYLTIALSESVMKLEESVEAIIDKAASWDVDGFYVVVETPSAYLVEDINWLANHLILCSGLRLIGKEVMVGYSSHQMLCLAAANVDLIASGTWLNVRAFPIEKFDNKDADSVSRRTTWFYCPDALSEYKLTALDAAQRLDVLQELKPSDPRMLTYCEALFSGAQPSTVGWNEQFAFRHYLTCLRFQVADARQNTFQESYDYHLRLLDSAEAKNGLLRDNSIFGQDRDFADYFSVNRTALAILKKVRGPQLKRSWK